MELIELVRAAALPPGRVINDDDGEGEPAFWLSDDPVDTALWRQIIADHQSTGLWPLVLGSATADEGRPWVSGEMYKQGITSPAEHDPEALLATWWRNYTKESGDVTAPFGQTWPGLAPPLPHHDDADEMACAARLLQDGENPRLGLVAAGRGADALAEMGWSGPANYVDDTGEIAAVLRSWEDRFGARVVGLEGYDTLYMSVAAPPSDHDQALRIAAEHFAFCPDNVWQNTRPSTLDAYASRLVGRDSWTFWWD